MCHFLAILGSTNWSILLVCNTNMLTFISLPKIIHLSNLTLWVAYLGRFFFLFFCHRISFSTRHCTLSVMLGFLLVYAFKITLLYVSDHVGSNSRERLCG